MSTTWIDFKELRSNLKFLDVLQFYKVDVKVRGDRASGICPLPGHPAKEGKRRASFSCHLTKGVFQCFSCQGKGNLLDFAVLMDGGQPDDPVAFRKTALRLAEQFGIQTQRRNSETRSSKNPAPAPTPLPTPVDGVPAPSVPVIINAPLDFELKHLDPTHSYLKDRGFTAETIERFGLGFCDKGMMKDRIAIPLHDAEGRLVGYAGRLVDDSKTSDESPKYRFPGSREREGKMYEFRKSHLLYGLHYLPANVNDLIVVEGFASVWWLHQHGYTNVVALMGSHASSEQMDLILGRLSEDGRLYIFTDEDDAGRECAKSLLCNMASRRWVKWIRCGDEYKQPTDFTADELAARPWHL